MILFIMIKGVIKKDRLLLCTKGKHTEPTVSYLYVRKIRGLLMSENKGSLAMSHLKHIH